MTTNRKFDVLVIPCIYLHVGIVKPRVGVFPYFPSSTRGKLAVKTRYDYYEGGDKQDIYINNMGIVWSDFQIHSLFLSISYLSNRQRPDVVGRRVSLVAEQELIFKLVSFSNI